MIPCALVAVSGVREWRAMSRKFTPAEIESLRIKYPNAGPLGYDLAEAYADDEMTDPYGETYLHFTDQFLESPLPPR